MSVVNTTYEALEEWLSFIHEISPRWGALMDEAWLDLPPHVSERLLDAANSLADSHELLKQAFKEQEASPHEC